MYLNVKRMSQAEGVDFLKQKYGLSDTDAFRTYNEIAITPADTWISPWPSYGGTAGCQQSGNSVQCENGLQFDLESNVGGIKDASGKWMYPAKVAIMRNDGTVSSKEFKENLIPAQNNRVLGTALIQSGSSWFVVMSDPALADSVFTRLYWHDGKGLKYFKQLTHQSSFNGNQIFVYKVDWDGTQSSSITQEQQPAVAQLVSGANEGQEAPAEVA